LDEDGRASHRLLVFQHELVVRYLRAKNGGFLIIADHSAKTGDGISVAKTLHRIEESTVRQEIEAAGFKLVAEADFLRHPEDPRNAVVFRPQVPTDEFVLKYQKPL